MTERRTLRSKRLRAAIWIAADGHCQMCGESLGPRWHADHIVPWVVSRTTNVHEMQALCAECNLQKGASNMKALRKHQAELQARARDIAACAVTEKVTTASVTPGGGKTLAAAIFARVLLDAGVIDRVAWVCPRSSLASQSCDGFHDRVHNPKYTARRADNTPPLIRDAELGRVCYTTTYQSIVACPELHRDEVRRARTLVILDEPHHLADEEGRTWAKAVGEVVDVAAHVLLMSGTIERHDRIRIPFLEYEDNGGRSVPVSHVSYSLRDALGEKAVIPIEFTYVDGWVRYLHDGVEKSADISKASPAEVSRVIQTFLSQGEYRDAIVRRGMDHWMAFAASVYPSRAIVVCASVQQAREVAAFVGREYGVQVALAVSEDPDSQRTIEDFRKGRRGKVLVTVGMAYEGLDVPDCTHLICLTATRSVPWLMQAFARVTRVDWKAVKAGVVYERQTAFIFVPDDPLMRDVVEAIKAEQSRGLAEQKQKAAEQREQPQRGMLIPIETREGEIGKGTIEGRMPDADAALALSIQATVPTLAHVPAADILRAVAMAKSSNDQAPDSEPPAPDNDEETRLRRAIETFARSRDKRLGVEYGTTNKLIRRMFSKSREAMGIVELRNVLAYVHRLDPVAS